MPRITLFLTTAIVGTLVPMSFGAWLPRDSTCTYPTGKISLGGSYYLGFDNLFQVYVETDITGAASLQLDYCGTSTTDTFEITHINGTENLGLLGIAQAPQYGPDLLLTVVDHSASGDAGQYDNPQIPELFHNRTASTIWRHDPATNLITAYVHMPNATTKSGNSNDLSTPITCTNVAFGFNLVTDSFTNLTQPLFLWVSGSRFPQKASLTWVPDTPLPSSSPAPPTSTPPTSTSPPPSSTPPPPSTTTVTVTFSDPSPTSPSPPPSITTTVTGISAPMPTQTPWGQCGGQSYTGGVTQCGEGYVCIARDDYYSACVSYEPIICDKPAPTPGAPLQTKALYDQCAGDNMVGATPCDAGLVCVSQGNGPHFSQCLTLDANSTMPC